MISARPWFGLWPPQRPRGYHPVLQGGIAPVDPINAPRRVCRGCTPTAPLKAESPPAGKFWSLAAMAKDSPTSPPPSAADIDAELDRELARLLGQEEPPPAPSPPATKPTTTKTPKAARASRRGSEDGIAHGKRSSDGARRSFRTWTAARARRASRSRRGFGSLRLRSRNGRPAAPAARRSTAPNWQRSSASLARSAAT